MAEQKSFKFFCPHCRRHLEAEYDMVGFEVECPDCGRSLIVPDFPPASNAVATARKPAPVITVVRKRENFIDKGKNRLKAIGIGVAVLVLFVGAGVFLENFKEFTAEANARAEAMAVTQAVATSIDRLVDFVNAPSEGRADALAGSLEACPADFQKAMVDFIVSISKTGDDMISDKEREDVVTGTVFLGLLAGAVSDTPGEAFSSGLQIGNLMQGEMQATGQKRLEREIRSKLCNLIDTAQKYGVDSQDLKNLLR